MSKYPARKRLVSLCAVPAILFLMGMTISATPQAPVEESVVPVATAHLTEVSTLTHSESYTQVIISSLDMYKEELHAIEYRRSDIEEPTYSIDQSEAEMLAKAIWGEARGVESVEEQAAVAWCVLNRVDATGYGMGGSIEYVLTFPDQFDGYVESYPVTDELYELAVDVLSRWYAEKAGDADVGRVLPPDYLWFTGDGVHNNYRNAYSGTYSVWDWSLSSPYSD